jgi:hypothetical protein
MGKSQEIILELVYRALYASKVLEKLIFSVRLSEMVVEMSVSCNVLVKRLGGSILALGLEYSL